MTSTAQATFQELAKEAAFAAAIDNGQRRVIDDEKARGTRFHPNNFSQLVGARVERAATAYRSLSPRPREFEKFDTALIDLKVPDYIRDELISLVAGYRVLTNQHSTRGGLMERSDDMLGMLAYDKITKAIETDIRLCNPDCKITTAELSPVWDQLTGIDNSFADRLSQI